MSENPAVRLWGHLKDLFVKEGEHLVSVFFAEKDSAPLVPNDSYLRLSLSELFLADEKEWGGDHIPAVQASIRLKFTTTAPQTFTTLVQPSVPTGRGVVEDYPLTEWLPYRGQAVEFEAALYQILGKNNLLTAISILSDFTSLVTPPVSAALAIVDKVAAGIEKVVEANAKDPALVVHKTLSGEALRPGWLAVIRATDQDLNSQSLYLNEPGKLSQAASRLTGYDFLVLRVEGTADREDWRTPDLDAAIKAAGNARAMARKDEYERLRDEALTKIYLSPDLTGPHQRQLAKLVQEELDTYAAGAAGAGGMTVADIVARRGLPSRSEVQHLTLSELLSA